MFGAITWFELKNQLKQPAFYIYVVIFGLLAYGSMVSENVNLAGPKTGNMILNAPSMIIRLTLMFCVLSALVTTALMVPAINRDFESNMTGILFTMPLKKRDYVGGRFVGSLIASLAAYALIVGAILYGGLTTTLDPERMGPFSLIPYLVSYFVFAAPAVLLTGAISFSVILLTRSMAATIIGHCVFFGSFFVAFGMRSNLAMAKLASLADPFGSVSYSIATKYWTVVERNTLLWPDSPDLLLNRMIWLTVPLLILAYAYNRFDFSEKTTQAQGKKALLVTTGETVIPTRRALPEVHQQFSNATGFSQYLAETRQETLRVMKSLPFLAMLLISAVMTLAALSVFSGMMGVSLYPTTGSIVGQLISIAIIFTEIAVIFYSGDCIWRERSLRLAQVYDALPMPTWLPMAAKFTALGLALAAMTVFYIFIAIIYQLSQGYTHLELPVYLISMFVLAPYNISFLGYLCMCAAAFFFQIFFNNKYVGFLITVLLLFDGPILEGLGLTHDLFNFGVMPNIPYSDMNGFGHFATPGLWYTGFWLSLSLLLLSAAYLLWPRGVEVQWKNRFHIARARLSGGVILTLLLATFAGAGSAGYIYYNTNILNTFRSPTEQERRQAEFEQKYKQYRTLPMPTITAVQANVDIFPHERQVLVHAVYTVQNKTALPQDQLHLNLNPIMTLKKMEVPTGQLETDDKTQGYFIYRLSPVLAPGDSLQLSFDFGYEPRGFKEGLQNTSFVENGMFVHSNDHFPHIGYRPDWELTDKNKRKMYNLPPPERVAALTDSIALNQVSDGLPDASRIRYETTVSTSSDQIAIAPGYLEKEWTDPSTGSGQARHYYHYKMDAPIWFYFAYMSGRYTVQRDKWTSPEGVEVPIEVYYHANHAYNVARMISGAQKALAYCAANFSPYQYRQFRIIEFPNYRNFAEAFPNTIPYSEGAGFIMKQADKDVDVVMQITAHEVGHQWWGHQVMCANVRGWTMVIESLAEYTGLMVMKQELRPEQIKKFLRQELEGYLRGRSREGLREVPLLSVENQPYIHYNKGGLVMYALQDYIGEANLNRALAAYIDSVAYQSPPYSTPPVFLNFIRAVTPDSLQYVLTDLFETITLYDNKTKSATYTKLNTGQYLVKLEVEAQKLRADSLGVETPIPLADYIDIGIFRKDGDTEKTLYLQRHKITAPTTTLEITVDEQPTNAGIDPFNKLIDRQPEDNTKRVEETGKGV